MANKKITDVDVVSVINDTDFLFINQGDALKQIKKSDIPKPTYTAEEVGALPDTTKIPSKTSDIENDLGFLTQHQDLSNYIAKDNTEVFDPVNDYNPATKKYVDDNKFSGSYNDLTNTPTSLPASDVFNWAKAETKPSYTANEVGADSTGTAENKVSSHNTAINAHNDIRILIQELTDRLNALADSDDTTLDQMSEIVAYIKSNRTLIEDITTGKISTSDIIDDLITNVSNKPLSAAQGVVLKGLIDAIVIPTKTSDLTNDSGFLTEHQDISEKVDRKELASVATSGSYSDLKNIPDLLLVNGDSQNNIVTFESTDSIEDSNILWNDVGLLQSEETHKSLFNKISTMFKNIRYLYKLIGNTDISTISDGTVTGVIDELNGKIEKPTLYSSAEKQIGVTDSGEPIYRKTIYANMGSFKIPSSGYQQADIGTGVVIGKLFNISCHIIGFKNYALPYCGNGTAWGTWLNTVEKVGTQHVLRFYNNVNWGSGYTLVATIDYTK